MYVLIVTIAGVSNCKPRSVEIQSYVCFNCHKLQSILNGAGNLVEIQSYVCFNCNRSAEKRDCKDYAVEIQSYVCLIKNEVDELPED